MRLSSRNAATMRSAQARYDNASPPDDGPEPNEEHYAEARNRLLDDYGEDDLLEYQVDELARRIMRGEA